MLGPFDVFISSFLSFVMWVHPGMVRENSLYHFIFLKNTYPAPRAPSAMSAQT